MKLSKMAASPGSSSAASTTQRPCAWSSYQAHRRRQWPPSLPRRPATTSIMYNTVPILSATSTQQGTEALRSDGAWRGTRSPCLSASPEMRSPSLSAFPDTRSPCLSALPDRVSCLGKVAQTASATTRRVHTPQMVNW